MRKQFTKLAGEDEIIFVPRRHAFDGRFSGFWPVGCDNQEMPDLKLTVIDSNALPWEERPNEKIGRSLYRKNLIVDPDTGMEVRLVRYPAGAVNPLHTHPCAHGMYVLEGTLVTHDGQYGPGHFVWFPEGSLMEHGATAEQDVTVLFITNKSFEIHYR
jgi:quercetin dioxygenase-like cupin family protein